jgi:F-type H+-transporting ATPase subunit b
MTVTGTPGAFQVQGVVPQQETATTEQPAEGPSPITPELKELAWGAGSFIVLLIAVRLFLYPKIRKGMDARYNLIREELESAEATTAAAEAELADYEAQLARVRAEAASRIDASRQTLEAERQAKLTDVNAEISAMRSAGAAEWETARASAQEQVTAAAARVAAATVERVLDRPIDLGSARAAVDEALSAGART